MASETVEQICKRLKELGPFAFKSGNIVGEILFAHKRELAAVSAERDEWQKQALEENAALDVARADLAAKDAEIARLKSIMITKEAFDRVWLTSHNKTLEIKNLRALIKELADAFEGDAFWSEEIALIAKAREVCK